MTQALSWMIFCGQGSEYLGYKYADSELQDDGSWKKLGYDHAQLWTVEKSHNYWRTCSLLKHLQGHYRGLVTNENSGCTEVPFLGVDLDRHHNEDPDRHIETVIRVGRLCIKLYPFLRWCVESNLYNGSVKFFGFGRRTIPIGKAREMAKALYQSVIQITGKTDTEVFPHNLNQVLLPFRDDKQTIITGGELGKVQRWKNKPVREQYTAYSMLKFNQWLEGEGHYDEVTLRKTLQQVCKPVRFNLDTVVKEIKVSKPVSRLEKLRDQAFREAMGLDVPESASFKSADASLKKDASLGRGINRGSGLTPCSLPSDPQTLESMRTLTNSFDRKRQFVQWLARRLRRVPTLEETLTAYRENNMYGGAWDDGLRKRESDFKAIIRFVEQGFDLSLCGQNKSQRPELDEKMLLWQGRARTEFIYQQKFETSIYQTRTVDEYGVEHVSAGRTRWVQGEHLPVVMAIIDQVKKEKPDGAIPRDSIQGWWEELAEENILPKWSVDYWIACRQVLGHIGWIKVNHTYSHRDHLAKTCLITFGNGGLVGTLYCYPMTTTYSPPPPIRVVMQTSPEFESSETTLTPRPPPDDQQTTIRRYLPSFEEQISWN